jgi:hypothetical protein
LPQNYQLASFSGGGGLSNASVDANGNYVGGSVTYSTVNTVTLAPSTGAILLNTTNPSPPPSPPKSPPPPPPITAPTPVGGLTLFGFGFGPTGRDLFEVDSKGEVFAQTFGPAGPSGTP